MIIIVYNTVFQFLKLDMSFSLPLVMLKIMLQPLIKPLKKLNKIVFFFFYHYVFI